MKKHSEIKKVLYKFQFKTSGYWFFIFFIIFLFLSDTKS